MATRFFSSAAIFAFAVLLPIAATGQDGNPAPVVGASQGIQVVGNIFDRQSGEPVSAAVVEFFPAGADTEPVWTGSSDARGRFVTNSLQTGEYRVEIGALTYTSVNHVEVFPEQGVVDLRIEMVRVDYELEPLIVAVRRENRLERTGFYNREQRGIGHFINRADIQARRPGDVSDLFRQIPGTRVLQSGVGAEGLVRLRGGCVPLVVVDAMELGGSVRLDDILAPSDIEAVEVYQGATTPIRYAGRNTCGTIMVWTRSPPEPTGNSISLKKFTALVGFTALAVLSTRR